MAEDGQDGALLVQEFGQYDEDQSLSVAHVSHSADSENQPPEFGAIAMNKTTVTKTKKAPTRQRLKEELRRLDPNLDPRSDMYKTALILLSLAFVPWRRVCTFTGLPSTFVEERLDRLKANGIIATDGSIHANWFKKDGAIDFWCDVNVAEGLMNRV